MRFSKTILLTSVFVFLSVISGYASTVIDVTSYTVKFESRAAADSVIDAHPEISFERVIPASNSIEIEGHHAASGLDLFYIARTAKVKDTEALMSRTRKFKGVVTAEPTLKVKISESIEKDIYPEYKQHLGSEDYVGDPLSYRQWDFFDNSKVSINLDKAWSLERGNPNVIVAVMDCWIDHSHSDLSQNMWVNETELNGQPGVDDDGNGYVDDIYGYNFFNPESDLPGSHGTHIAGTIAASNNNGIGVCGIAGGDGMNPGVRIMSIGINNPLSGKGFVEDWVVCRAFVYAADNGANIASNSWGGGDRVSSLITTGINYFIDNAGSRHDSPMKGGLVVFAAGNDDWEVRNFPFNDPELKYESIVTVGSVTAQGVKSSFSNYGTWVDIMAPGGEHNGESIYSTEVDNKYILMNGTSMACPHVSGVAALILSKYQSSGLTPSAVKEILLSTAQDVYRYNAGRNFHGKLGRGIVDAYAALLDNPNISPASVSDLRIITNSQGHVDLKFTIPADGNGQAVAKCALFMEGDKAPILELRTGGLEANTAYHSTFEPKLMPTEGMLYIRAIDRWGNESENGNIVRMEVCESPTVLGNPYNIKRFSVFKPTVKGVSHTEEEIIQPLIVSLPVFSNHLNVSVSDENNIVSVEKSMIVNDPTITLTFTADNSAPLGVFPFIIRLENSADPSDFAEVEFEYEVVCGVYNALAPRFIDGMSGDIYLPELSGCYDINLLDYIYDPFGLDFIIPEKVEVNDGMNFCTAGIYDNVLHIEYEFDEEEIFWGADKIIVTVSPVDDYAKPNPLDFIFHAPNKSGIGDVNADKIQTLKGIYTITGIKLNSSIDDLPNGIYIVDGQKVMISNRSK